MPPPDRADDTRIVPLAAAVALGYLSINISPILLGAVSDGMDLTESRAGLLTTLEDWAFAFCTLGLGPWTGHFPKRRVVLLAALVVAAGHGIAACSHQYAVVAMARVTVGLGEGTMIAMVYSIISGTHRSQRNFGTAISVNIAIGGVTYLVLPHVSAQFAHHGAYGFMAAVTLLAWPLLWLLPKESNQTEWPAVTGVTRLGDVILFLASLMLIMFSDGMVWPLSERVGQSIGMTHGHIGLVLGISSGFGACGSLLAGRMGNRFGLMFPLIAGAACTALGGLLMMSATTPAVLFAGGILKSGGMLFFMPLAMEAASILDRQGRISAISSGVLLLGFGFGPYVAGHIVEQEGFPAVGVVSVTIAAVGTILLRFVLIRAQIQKRATTL